MDRARLVIGLVALMLTFTASTPGLGQGYPMPPPQQPPAPQCRGVVRIGNPGRAIITYYLRWSPNDKWSEQVLQPKETGQELAFDPQVCEIMYNPGEGGSASVRYSLEFARVAPAGDVDDSAGPLYTFRWEGSTLKFARQP